MSLAILLTQLRIANVRTLASSAHEAAPRERNENPDVGARFLGLSREGSASPAAAANTGKPNDSGTTPLLPWQVDWCQPIALLVGNEGAGLPEEIERSADARIRIPMAGGIESLNAAAAAAVLFYEAARQRSAVQAKREATP